MAMFGILPWTSIIFVRIRRWRIIIDYALLLQDASMALCLNRLIYINSLYFTIQTFFLLGKKEAKTQDLEEKAKNVLPQLKQFKLVLSAPLCPKSTWRSNTELFLNADWLNFLNAFSSEVDSAAKNPSQD